MLYPEALTHVAFQRIARTELEFLRGLDHERWLLFDLNGNLLDMVDGSRYQVGISAEVIRQLKPAASSHNHLWEVAHSEDDVLTAIHSDFLEACVIGPAHRYRLARPTTGWPDPHVAEDFLQRAWLAEWTLLGDGDPAAGRLLRRRVFEHASGSYSDPTDPHEVVAWATCHWGMVNEFSLAFAAHFVIEPLP